MCRCYGGKALAELGDEEVTTGEIDLQVLRSKLIEAGLPNLWAPRHVKVVDAIPLLDSGKLDLKSYQELAKEIETGRKRSDTKESATSTGN